VNTPLTASPSPSLGPFSGLRIGLWYDLRNPPDLKRSTSTLYRQVLEQISWAETLGFGSVWFSEHHFTDDGYTPSPLVVAAAIAQRTTTMTIGTDLLLLPLHDPIRVAEDASTVSLLSGGRFDLGVALGYRETEYNAFGRSIRHRPSLLSESIAIIRAAWSGEELAHNGMRFNPPQVRITPVPDRAPRILVGGMAEPAIQRAAALGDGFLANAEGSIDTYVKAVRDLGREPFVCSAQWAVIADDPDREWAAVGDRAVHQMNTYIDWGAFGPPDLVPRFLDRDSLRASGFYSCWSPSEAVDQLTTLVQRHPYIRDIHLWAQLPGEPVDAGSARLETIAKHVIPHLTTAQAGALT
jgi:alkanesulfonate monooxygenase SsuD/methylene tetrahydromethanopterin reductase-like flavin-dependent oxidoreductase (luciferase family)